MEVFLLGMLQKLWRIQNVSRLRYKDMDVGLGKEQITK